MFLDEIDFHTLFDGILGFVLLFLGEVLHGKSADFSGEECMV